MVNTATACGYTPQFEGLEALYRPHRADGFVVLGFPANDFAGQEPRSDKQIAAFCKANYGVSFPMFAKTTVTGDGANRLFRRLTAAAGAPEWNFNKYLVDRRGRVVARFSAGTEPDGSCAQERRCRSRRLARDRAASPATMAVSPGGRRPVASLLGGAATPGARGVTLVGA